MFICEHEISASNPQVADPNFTTVLSKNITFTVNTRKFVLKASLVGANDQTNGTTGNETTLLQFRIQMFDQSTGRVSEALDWRVSYKLLLPVISHHTIFPIIISRQKLPRIVHHRLHIILCRFSCQARFAFGLAKQHS